MSDPKSYSPLMMVEANAKSHEDAARAHRADAARSLQRAAEADEEAVRWRFAAAILKATELPA